MDTDEQLRSHIQWFILIRVVLFTLLLGISFFLSTKDPQIILPAPYAILLFITLVYIFSIASAFFVRKIKIRLRRFGIFQLLADTVFMAMLVYATGCSQSIFTAVFILPIIAGGLIMYRLGGLIPASSATILYGIVLTAEYLKILPGYYARSRYMFIDDYFVSMNVFTVYGLTFFLIAILSGVLARKLRRTEDALTLTELKLDRLFLLYKQIFDDIITGIITVDDDGFVTSINPAAENITGYSKDEIIGRRLSDVYTFFAVGDSDRQVADLKKKNGDLIRIGYSYSSLNLSPGQNIDDPEYSNCKVITLQDISRIEEMEREMRKAEKMATIGELSASIAHDFRNPLAAISGSAQILSMEINELSPDHKTTLQNLSNIILRESDRMADTITDFLHYARPMNPSPQWCNLYELANEVKRSIDKEKNRKYSCQITISIAQDLQIYADEQLLSLALTHLLKNGCYASRDSGEPVILSAFNDAAAGQVVIEVKDKGEGFSNKIKGQLFDPFFSTRDDTAGLGLAIVQQIINSHGGTMELAGEVNKGCRVVLTFPNPESTLQQS